MNALIPYFLFQPLPNPYIFGTILAQSLLEINKRIAILDEQEDGKNRL
jgi:hypothetical protein